MNTEHIEKLPYNIDKLSRCNTYDDVCRLYPEFKLYSEFRADCGFTTGKAIALIVLLYSKDTYVSAKHSSEKINAAVYLGFEQNACVISNPAVHNALLCNNKPFNDMVIRYCRMQYDSEFSELVIFNNAFYNQLMALNDGKSENSDKTKDIIQNVGVLKKQIKEIETRMLNENVTPENVSTLYEHVEMTALGLRPEDIAEKMRAGEVPVDVNPYGKDYSFQKYGTRDKMYPADDKV
jgi:hypothetical protein